MSSDQFFIQQFGTEQGPVPFTDLQLMARSGQIKGSTLLRKEGGQWFPAKELTGVFSEKEWIVALLISFFLGGLGIDRFYLGQTGLGVAKLLTLGGCGVWALIDFILIALNNVKDADGLPLRK
ncbi:hypothetical protein GETHLI_34550 [Geothrix limicola]|uniref:TM2 domain-containing protein n=1 Tax=Geothrix limicola TaxID=2927978 RepID=A0ABQ5QLA3_9BACT|nr:NINE protein [Geothrix limicola]GLH74953.1 hypothetical protein GETHLI_34550 [Geothrix limicola]